MVLQTTNDFNEFLWFSAGLWYKSQYLREAQVNLLAQDVCGQKDYYGNLITENMFCAARPDWSQDACEVILHVRTWTGLFLPFSSPTYFDQLHLLLLLLLLLLLHPAGRLWRSTGLWDPGQALPVRGHQLGWRLCQRVQAWSLRQSQQLQRLDRREDGPELHGPGFSSTVTVLDLETAQQTI